MATHLRAALPAYLRSLLLLSLLSLLAVGVGCTGSPVSQEPGTGNVTLEVATDSPTGRMGAVQVIVLLTVLSLAPAVLMLMTSFTRIIIVLSFVRTALGVQQLPPNQVLLGLALFLTFFVMAPVWERVNKDAVQPYLAGDMKEDVAIQRGMGPLRSFMLRHTREKDVELFASMANLESVASPQDVPDHVLIPAFVISELKSGFQMGFMVFIPFLVIDLVVASVLMSMGMMMLPPVVISLPFKVLLFIMVDGWHLITRSLLISFA